MYVAKNTAWQQPHNRNLESPLALAKPPGDGSPGPQDDCDPMEDLITTQLSHFQIPDPQKLHEIKHVFVVWSC